MISMTRGSLGAAAMQFIEEWLASDNARPSRGTIPDRILEVLRQAGFGGCGEHLELEGGYFFPQRESRTLDEAVPVVAAGVRWVHGAPGLLVSANAAGVHRCCDVGVFVGPVPRTGECIDVA
jgi:hypothetical protein